MAARVGLFDADEEHFDMRGLWRVVAWGSGAAVAIAVAVLAAASQPGSQRLAEVWSGSTSATRSAAAQLKSRSAELEGETRRLGDAVRILTTDRDRMLARINTLEHTLDDATGSLGRDAAPARSSAPQPAPAVAPPSTAPAVTPAPSVAATPALSSVPGRTAAAPAPAPPPSPTPSKAEPILPPIPAPPAPAAAPANAVPAAALPGGWTQATALPLDVPNPASGDSASWPDADANPAAESTATRTEFGIDIGGGASVEALRALWTSAKHANGSLLEKLRPVVGIREVRPGYVELRLIVGPLTDAAAAARLCAALGAHGRTCKPAVFDGQRLALR